MEEKRKSFRPTLTAYRALEEELRDEYAKHNAARNELADNIASLRAENDKLRSENEFLRTNLDVRTKESDDLEKELSECREELRRIKNQSLWERIFNR